MKLNLELIRDAKLLPYRKICNRKKPMVTNRSLHGAGDGLRTTSRPSIHTYWLKNSLLGTFLQKGFDPPLSAKVVEGYTHLLLT